jgi:hypothetical protein
MHAGRAGNEWEDREQLFPPIQPLPLLLMHDLPVCLAFFLFLSVLLSPFFFVFLNLLSHPTTSSPSHARSLCLSCLFSLSACIAFSLIVCFLYIYHLLSHPTISSPSHARSLCLSCFLSLSILLSPSLPLHFLSVVLSITLVSASCTLSLSVLLSFAICLSCFLPHCLFSLNLSSVVPSKHFLTFSCRSPCLPCFLSLSVFLAFSLFLRLLYIYHLQSHPTISSPSHARSLCLSCFFFSICLYCFLPHCLLSLNLSYVVPSITSSPSHARSLYLSCFL